MHSFRELVTSVSSVYYVFGMIQGLHEVRLLLLLLILLLLLLLLVFLIFLFSTVFLFGRKGRQVVSYNIKYWWKYRVYI